MKAVGAMIVWTPADDGDEMAGKVGVIPWPARGREGMEYRRSGGACYTAWREASETKRDLLMMLEFHTCVVRDGIDPQVVHEAFLKIDEYRRRIAPDVPGAEE